MAVTERSSGCRRPSRPGRAGRSGRGSCRRHRRGRWSPVVGRACRAGGRRPRSRPRTARGTARRRGRPGSGAGTAAPPQPGRCPGRARRGSVTVAGQGGRERLGALPGRSGVDDRAVAGLELATRWRAKAPTASRPPVSLEEAQRAGGQVVVGLVERVATGVGDARTAGPAGPGRGPRCGAARAPRPARRPAARPGAGVRRRASGRAARPGRRRWWGRSPARSARRGRGSC